MGWLLTPVVFAYRLSCQLWSRLRHGRWLTSEEKEAWT